MHLQKKISFLILFLGALLFLTNVNYSQDSPQIVVFGKVATSAGKKLDGATITLKKNGSTVASVTSASNGRYPEMKAPMGHIYTLTIVRDGYVSKEILIDTKTGYYEEDANPVTQLDIPFDLDEKKPDVDYSAVTNGFQIGKMAIDPAIGGLAIDSKFSSKQKSQYEKFFKDLEAKANQEEENFNKLVTEGDNAIASGDFGMALTKYEEALKIKAGDANVTSKVADTKVKIETKKNFDNTVTAGDQALSAKNFDQAIAKYQAAKALLPNDKTIDAKIKDAETQKAANATAELDKKYNDKIAEAKKALDDKDYGYAKSLYQEAGTIKPSEKEPPAKVIEIDKIIKDQLENEKKFAELVNAGNKSMLSEEYDNSIAKFEEALKIKNDASVETELAKAKDLKAKKEAAENALKEKKAKFDAFIASGDGKIGSKDFDAAINEFKSALALGVDNDKANAKIKSAEDAKKAAEDAAKAEAEAQAAAEKKAKFDAFITAGDGKVGSKDFDAAINEFKSALALGVDNDKANAKIKSAEDAKKAAEDAAKADAEAQAAAEKKAKFDAFITAGDGKVGSKDFDAAIAEYNSALALEVDNPKANEKITAAKAAKKAHEDAMGAEAAAQAAAEKKAKFDAFITAGDGKLSSKDFDAAISEYNSALALEVDNPKANEKITAAKAAKKSHEEQQSANSAQAQLDAEFNKLIADGDAARDTKDWEKAKDFYVQANAKKPSDPLPQKKIDELKKLMDEQTLVEQQAQLQKYLEKGKEITEAGEYDKAIGLYNKAKGIFKGEPILDQRIEEVTQLKAKETEYNSFLASADNKFEKGEWENAKADYLKAKSIFDRPRPNEQIALIDKKLQEANNKDKEAEELAKKQAAYDALMQKGKSQKENKSYKEAIATYQSAKAILPNEKEPQARIDEINKILADLDNNNALMQKYNAAIAKADAKRDEAKSAESEDLVNEAKELYNAANKIKSDETYPQSQVDALNDFLKLLRAKSEDTAYQKIIDKADELFNADNLDKAEGLYKRAIDLKPSDPYPPEQLKKIQAARANAGKVDEFNNLVKEGNKLFGEEDYLKALSTFQKASGMKPEANYPKKKIEEINDILNKRKQEESAKNKKEELALVDPNYRGERVMGVSELEADQWFKDAKLSYLEGNDAIIEQRKVDKLSFEDLEKETQLSRTETGHSDLTKLVSDRSELEKTWDNQRLDNIPEVETYKGKQLELNNSLVERTTSSTYNDYESRVDMIAKFEQFSEDGDFRRREETVAAVDTYKFKQENLLEDRVQTFTDKTDKLNENNTEMQLRIDKTNLDADKPRQENVSAMEIYQESYLNNNSNKVESFTEKTLANHENKENVKELQSKLMNEKDKMREQNIDDLDQYKENLLNEDGKKAESLSGVGYDKSLEYDEIKNQKATMFSDENVDPLAKQYPEGITEEMYQRKNNMGEVIEVTILRIVVNGNKADEYKKVTTRWTTNYFKNGGIITQHIWDTETH